MIINLDHRYRTGDRVCRNDVLGTVRACKIVVNLSTDAPAVLAYDIAFDDGRRLTVEEADLELMTAAWRAEHQAGE